MRILGLLVIGVAALTVVPAGIRVSAAVTGPILTVSGTVLDRGGSVTLNGSGWPAGSSLQASLCGADAVDGSVDCANTESVAFSPDASGLLTTSLPVVYPPKPCPCVLMVTSLAGYDKTFPVDIVGDADAPASTRPTATTLDPPPTTKASVSDGPSQGRDAVSKTVDPSAPWTWALLAFGGIGAAFLLRRRAKPVKHPAHRVARQSLWSWSSRRSPRAERTGTRCLQKPSTRGVRFYQLPPSESTAHPVGRHVRHDPVEAHDSFIQGVGRHHR
jgi:MYXO-CTERM domain-containing protein